MSGKDSQDTKDDENVLVKFSQKEKEIKIKELERSTQKKAAALGLPYIDLVGFPISPETIAMIKETEAMILNLICFYYDGKNIRLAATDPEDQEVKDKLKELEDKYFASGEIYLISDHSLKYGLELYRSVPKTREFFKGVQVGEEDLNKYSDKFSTFRDLQGHFDKAQLSDIVTMLLAASIKSGASDIHIEAEEKDIKVRFRIDGILHDVAVLKVDLWKKIISRMKGLAGVKINVNDKPQDGRLSILTKAERIDIRASFLPTNFGESVVMRILRSSSVGLTFEELGLRSEQFEYLKKEVERPNGMIITTGPTGSGKTTTLYAILKKLNKPETKIITVEDPIEYQLEGVNQSQVGKNYTFAKALRSIVRQDPDIIMVGEIRDIETDETGIQAALTGHLVLSTIHTNDAAGAIPRFLAIGVKPFLLAPALNAIIGQRLVRRICLKCKQEAKLSEEDIARVKKTLEKLPGKYKEKINFDNLIFYSGQGCNFCQKIGYKGRIGIYEIMIMDAETEKVILSNKISEYEIRELAARKGMINMLQDGLLKALEGVTSVEEVFRVAGGEK